MPRLHVPALGGPDPEWTPEQRARMARVLEAVGDDWPAVAWLAAGRPSRGPLADLMLDWLNADAEDNDPCCPLGELG